MLKNYENITDIKIINSKFIRERTWSGYFKLLHTVKKQYEEEEKNKKIENQE